MVDVGDKPVTKRRATAEARMRMKPATAVAITRGDMPKGDVLSTARIAGIQAAKRTAELIPLAHPVQLAHVDVEIDVDEIEGVVTLTAVARAADRTGVEMEALTACTVAALTIYDMTKGVERGIEIEMVRLLHKSGGSRPPDFEPRVEGHQRAALLVISTSRADGEREDLGGPRLREVAAALGVEVVALEVVPDDRGQIASRLRHWADDQPCELILTTGGTGLAPSDVTPEATRDVIDRDAPGIAEAIRQASKPHTELWMVARGVAGVRGRTLIVNLPGNPAAIEQTKPVLESAVPHALKLLRGEGAH
jgi:cyclic pyranopterin monophosphate synthase